ncbi:helix-turn-helix domain-containing protein [Shouchella shacheensis]|uniref:helix-turn-helix domain-containing protein n=1 Tax=Shouchella shacheensis TaxID=1649580 RepID=UPI00073FACBA|nr:helix-turn-helix transcriptional regulator [Shouchella shacheensis]
MSGKNVLLIELREAKNKKQIDVALEANLSQGFYSKVENGKKRPSLQTQRSITKVVGGNCRNLWPDPRPDDIDGVPRRGGKRPPRMKN